MDDITISINAITVERIVYILVIFVLGLLLVQCNLSDNDCSDITNDGADEVLDSSSSDIDDNNTNTVTTSNDTENTKEASTEEEEESTNDSENTSSENDNTEEDTQEQDTSTTTDSDKQALANVPIGSAEIQVVEFDYVKKADDFGAVQAVTVKILNNNADFFPTVALDVYGGDIAKGINRKDYTIKTILDRGEVLELKIPLYVSFNEIDEQKDIEVELLDGELELDSISLKKTFEE